MDFLISANNSAYDAKINIDKYSICYQLNSRFSEREIIYDDSQIFIAADVNKEFIDKVSKREINISQIERNINYLKNGFIVVADKNRNKISIYTDILGYCHIFFIKDKNDVTISSSIRTLSGLSSNDVDSHAILDMYLFNYTLLDRTIFKNIKRFKGGSKIVINGDGFSVSDKFNFADNFKQTDAFKADPREFGEILSTVIRDEVFDEKKSNLTVTAGFDSRALLAACSSNKLPISAFTFGQKGNIEIETIKPFINKFVKKYRPIFLNEGYISGLREVVDLHVEASLDCPTLLDLPHYSYIRSLIEPSNLIVGFMGGEMIVGQSIGAQVTFTKFAADLLTSKNKRQLRESFINATESLGVFNTCVNDICEDYLDTLLEYQYDNSNLNILRFLINEKYSKFFGTVNKVFKNNCNLIVPLMDPAVIQYLLNSNLSFLSKRPFKNNPFINLESKIFYAKTIQSLEPRLGETRFDRLYAVNDLCKPYRFFNAATGFMKSRLLKRNKTEFPRPHDYDTWFKDLIIDAFGSRSFLPASCMFKGDFSFVENYDLLSGIEKKRLANIFSVSMAIKKISE